MTHLTSLPIKPILDKLYVVAVISNPARYRVRYDLYRQFKKHVEDSGAELYTVECSFGARQYEVTQAQDPHSVQLNSSSEIWHKENMVNIGISRLPPSAKYIAWVDADIQFIRPDWVQETLHQLQHYDIVQMWSSAHDLDPNHESFRTYRSFMSCYHQSINNIFDDKQLDADRNNGISSASYYASKPYWHSGFCYAAKRSAIDALGGLVDFCILGSADHHMALALIGEVDRSIPKGISKTSQYYKMLKEWENRAERFIKRNVGFVQGGIVHYWHGPKTSRRYNDRWKILERANFNPHTDLKKDWQGLYQLADYNPKLRDDLRFYFRQRNEDSIDFKE